MITFMCSLQTCANTHATDSPGEHFIGPSSLTYFIGAPPHSHLEACAGVVSREGESLSHWTLRFLV